MLAELHLTEDAFALHLLLQRPEGLVDIVVTDKNLHAVFLFDPTLDRPNSQGLDHWRIDSLPISNNRSSDRAPKSSFDRAYTASGRLQVTKKSNRGTSRPKAIISPLPSRRLTAVRLPRERWQRVGLHRNRDSTPSKPDTHF